MTFRTEKFITREMVRKAPTTLFVFGDNMQEIGKAGQAKEMRGEPNAVGIPTKWSPSMDEGAFFTDEDFVEFAIACRKPFGRLWIHVVQGGEIVWPDDGVGTGLAQLNTRAPKIFALIETLRKFLQAVE